jgi:hypothetical protein
LVVYMTWRVRISLVGALSTIDQRQFPHTKQHDGFRGDEDGKSHADKPITTDVRMGSLAISTYDNPFTTFHCERAYLAALRADRRLARAGNHPEGAPPTAVPIRSPPRAISACSVVAPPFRHPGVSCWLAHRDDSSDHRPVDQIETKPIVGKRRCRRCRLQAASRPGHRAPTVAHSLNAGDGAMTKLTIDQRRIIGLDGLGGPAGCGA